MKVRLRITRFAAAAALAISSMTLLAVSPVSAAVTGSLTPDGTGGLIVTYSGTTANDNVDFVIAVAGTNCSSFTPADEIAVLTTDPGAPPSWLLPASPATIAVGTTVMFVQGTPAPGPLTAGPYTFCLTNYNAQLPPVLVAQLDMTLGQAPVTTTTTTAPAADPVAPAFTG